MTEPMQIQQDLHFVRQAVARRTQHRSPASVLCIVAVYVLIGYTLIDFSPRWANWFFAIGGMVMWGLMGIIKRRTVRKEGEYDRSNMRKLTLHWFGGIALAGVSALALAVMIPALRGQSGAQVLVVMIGIVYFLGGVHFDHQFLWLGPVLIVGGVLVGLVPHYGWTALGVVIASGLVIPTLFKRASGDGEEGGASSERPPQPATV